MSGIGPLKMSGTGESLNISAISSLLFFLRLIGINSMSLRFISSSSLTKLLVLETKLLALDERDKVLFFFCAPPRFFFFCTKMF